MEAAVSCLLGPCCVPSSAHFAPLGSGPGLPNLSTRIQVVSDLPTSCGWAVGAAVVGGWGGGEAT